MVQSIFVIYLQLFSEDNICIMSALYPKNGIIYYHAGSHKSSAILFNEQFVLTSGLALLQVPFMTREFKNTAKQRIIRIDAHAELNFLQNLDYRIVLQRDNGNLLEKKAQIAYVIYSPDIESTIEQQFEGLRFTLNGEYCDISKYSLYFSSFVIFQFTDQKVSLENLERCFKSEFVENSTELSLLENIICVTAPFGNEHFINSINFGHVSNLIGKDNCLALLNISSAFGCEGGGIYDKNFHIRSILLASCFHHQNDNVHFPLAANVSEIYKILFDAPKLYKLPSNLTTLMTQSSCLITTNGTWGTGCLFRLNGRNFVLTCAHVLSNDNITCYCRDYNFQPILIHKNPIFDYAYDIALLEDTTKNQNNTTRLSNNIPKVGQIVYSVGFPIFKGFGMNGIFSPSIYRGKVTKYSKGVLITDCPVQAGQSGGPIFEQNGSLLAVMVSNFKNELDGKIYPHHNMCIPICDIYDILLRYSTTNDYTTINGFQAKKDIVDKWKLKTPLVESKL
ncbi:peroxisomal leader peptide-processing protease [Armigeres subalbatus]|uniref:peroxisomal leader peptide-processing protease n=1 Tax=Armigeres subalbatus TaxID=124917 RepID=UPI002ED28550